MKLGHQSRLVHLQKVTPPPRSSQGSLPLPSRLCWLSVLAVVDLETLWLAVKLKSHLFGILWSPSFPLLSQVALPPGPSLVSMLPIFKKVNICQPRFFPGSVGKQWLSMHPGVGPGQVGGGVRQDLTTSWQHHQGPLPFTELVHRPVLLWLPHRIFCSGSRQPISLSLSHLSMATQPAELGWDATHVMPRRGLWTAAQSYSSHFSFFSHTHLNLLVPRFPHPWNGENNSSIGLLWW